MNTFDPVQFSTAENEFLLTALGLAPIVAVRQAPPGVNLRAVRPVIEKVYELIELQKHSGVEWVGVDKIKESIKTYLSQAERWSLDKRKGRPRFPSMFTYDSRKRAHRSAPGSDSGQVRTYFGPDGERVRFEVDLVPDSRTDWDADWVKADEPKPKSGLTVDHDNKRIECGICGHTESFNPDSRASYNAARARTSKHLRTATEEVDAHRELHTNEFHT